MHATDACSLVLWFSLQRFDRTLMYLTRTHPFKMKIAKILKKRFVQRFLTITTQSWLLGEMPPVVQQKLKFQNSVDFCRSVKCTRLQHSFNLETVLPNLMFFLGYFPESCFPQNPVSRGENSGTFVPSPFDRCTF
jgi:hypothetical protein